MASLPLVSAETYIALRTTDDEVCSCCGRTGLKRAILVGLLDADGAVIETAPYGTTCAARATGREARALKSEASSGDYALKGAREYVEDFIARIRAEHAEAAEAEGVELDPAFCDADIRSLAHKRAGRLAEGGVEPGSFHAYRVELLLAL